MNQIKQSVISALSLLMLGSTAVIAHSTTLYQIEDTIIQKQSFPQLEVVMDLEPGNIYILPSYKIVCENVCIVVVCDV